MKEVRILSRNLHILREGDEDFITFSILNAIISDNNASALNSCVTSGFSVEIESWKISDYSSEIASVLYTDLPLYLVSSCSGKWILTTTLP